MAKRYSDTEKWTDPWFRGLSSDEKLMFHYLYDNCDIAGFIKYEVNYFAVSTGMSEEKAASSLHASKPLREALEVENGWIFIKDFLHSQGIVELNPDNAQHKGVISCIHRRMNDFSSFDICGYLGFDKRLISEFPGIKKALIKGLLVEENPWLKDEEEAVKKGRKKNPPYTPLKKEGKNTTLKKIGEIKNNTLSVNTGFSNKMTDEEFISYLKSNPAFSHINITKELHKMDAWLLVHPGRLKSKMFIINWLNKVSSILPPERPMPSTEAVRAKAREHSGARYEEEPVQAPPPKEWTDLVRGTASKIGETHACAGKL